MLSVPEFHLLLARARLDDELARRVLEVLDWADERVTTLLRAGLTLADAGRVARYGHEKYLPAAARYLRHGGAHSPASTEFRRARARLGGVSRALYTRQRETFEDVLELFPLTAKVPAGVVDAWWHQVCALERRRLSKARASASR
ncbi:MAG: hypothetical protein H7A47_15405 [Verrucomicrobiales bacterium]|nr:hypothetical protein [Verrucomicrobiales bacterium]